MPCPMVGDAGLPQLPPHLAAPAPLPLRAAVHFANSCSRPAIAASVIELGAARPLSTCSCQVHKNVVRGLTQAVLRP